MIYILYVLLLATFIFSILELFKNKQKEKQNIEIMEFLKNVNKIYKKGW